MSQNRSFASTLKQLVEPEFLPDTNLNRVMQFVFAAALTLYFFLVSLSTLYFST